MSLEVSFLFFFYFLKSGTSCGKGSDFQTIVSLSCRLLNSSLNSSLPNSYPPPPGRPNYIIMRPSKLGGGEYAVTLSLIILNIWQIYTAPGKIIIAPEK